MNQMNLPLLSEFEFATMEQLVSCKISRQNKETDEHVEIRIELMMKSQKFIDEVIEKCKTWNGNRIKLGLKPYK